MGGIAKIKTAALSLIMPNFMDFCFFLRALKPVSSIVARLPAWRRALSPFPDAPRRIPEDFFGVCVAPADDPAGDSYITDRINDLGAHQARLDFAENSFGGPQERLLQHLLKGPVNICLHLAPSNNHAASMRDAQTQTQWRSFVAKTMDTFGDKIEIFEIGSTVNRKKWSGTGPCGFMPAWKIAHEEGARRNIRLAAPNVTDFEPIYNAAFLDTMRKSGCLPDIHTTNLYVERATEPEAFDHKVMGRRLANLGRFTLVRKARLLQHIGALNGVHVFHCSHVSWSLRRIARILPDAEQKQADYLARYCLLAAASGALGRVYWGPLIGQREGLVDDGTKEFPELPHVTFYGRSPGHVSDYRIRPAFRAFQTINRLLGGSSFIRRAANSPSLFILEFETSNAERMHAAWTLNGRAALTAACYDATCLIGAKCLNTDGMEIPVPQMITEAPIYLLWPRSAAVAVNTTAEIEPDFAIHAHGRHRIAPFVIEGWKGFRIRREPDTDIASSLLKICRARSGSILRDSRNTVWRASAPWDSSQQVVIKQFRPPKGIKRLLQAGKPNRARRSWNGAQELLRRGLPTPLPIAFLEQTHKAAAECFYLCASFEGFSARDAFTAFRNGSLNFEGMSQAFFYEQIAAFLQILHDRGVFFRDLSAGNLLIQRISDNKLEFALIDTTRARFKTSKLWIWPRLLDMMRLCHPLRRTGRDSLLKCYLSGLNRPLRWWMRAPFAYYDIKHIIKGRLKVFRKK